MKNINSITRKRIEHRGFDVSATKNFGLEMKVVKQFNRPVSKGILKPGVIQSRNKEE